MPSKPSRIHQRGVLADVEPPAMDGEGAGLDRGLRLDPAARHRRDDAKPRPFQGNHAIALLEYDPQQQAAETLRAASATPKRAYKKRRPKAGGQTAAAIR